MRQMSIFQSKGGKCGVNYEIMKKGQQILKFLKILTVKFVFFPDQFSYLSIKSIKITSNIHN